VGDKRDPAKIPTNHAFSSKYIIVERGGNRQADQEDDSDEHEK